MKKHAFHGFLVATALSLVGFEASAGFVRPEKPGDPLIYGVTNGIFVALHPSALDGRPQGGPRGLIRVGYEENGRRYLINYIAIEPVVGSVTGYSELEKGGDARPGKRFWVGDGPRDGGVGTSGDVRGLVKQTPAGKALSFFVHVEPFANGARPVLEITLFEKDSKRIELRTFSGPGGSPMRRCVLTATMGNQSRCRWLWLRSGGVFAPDLYSGYSGTGFVEKGRYRLADLHRTIAGDVVAAISPDEVEPREVRPMPGSGWHHEGRWMAQYWLKRRGQFNPSLQCRVNGRRVYWGGEVPIPGGIAYENFEFQEDFVPGQEVWFGYEMESPAKAFGFPYDVSPRANGRRGPGAAPTEATHDQAEVEPMAASRSTFIP